MTCQLVATLIEDLVDGELAPTQAEQVREHIDSCPRCRAEYRAAGQLKSLLKQTRPVDPGREYWVQTADLIRARTIESPFEEQISPPTVHKTSTQRRALVRSLVSVAASFCVLVAAILIGSDQQERIATMKVADTPILATTAVSTLIGPDRAPIITPAEQQRLAKATLLMGNPSFLGRFTGLSEITEVN